MHYLLLSRFQGGLLGAALGAELGSYGERLLSSPSGSATRELRHTLNHWRPGLELNELQPTAAITAKLGTIVVSVAEALIKGSNWQQLDNLLAPLLTSSPALGCGTTLGLVTGAIATLPLALFFHDSEIKLAQILHQLAHQSQQAADVAIGSLVVSAAIALTLQDRFSPQQFIPQLIHVVEPYSSPCYGLTESFAVTDLMVRLEQVHWLLQKGSSLQTALTTLQLSQQPVSGSGAIALALFCYLSTPTDVRLAVGRAAYAGDGAALVSTLTGALGGLHNGLTGLPLAWRMATLEPAAPTLWGVSAAALMALATRLLAAWAGMYNVTAFLVMPAIAAPRGLRPHA